MIGKNIGLLVPRNSHNLFTSSYSLDPALIRPGRIDVKEYVGYCSKHQIEEMFKRFYTDENSIPNSVEFANKVMAFGKNVSPAQIQGFFMMHKTSSPADVIQNAGRIWEESRKNDLVKVT